MYIFQLCTIIRNSAQLYINIHNLHNYTQIYTIMHSYTQIYNSAQLYINIYNYAYAPLYTNKAFIHNYTIY